MATKKLKSTTAKRRPARRAPAKRAARRRSSGGVKTAGISLNVKDVAMAVVGALLADAYADKVPIKDPKMRYGALAAGAGFAATKAPKELRPFLIGAAIVGGVKLVTVAFPKLLPSPTTTTTTTTDGGAKSVGGLKTKTIGRRTASEEDAIREAVANAQVQRMNGSIMGRQSVGIMGRRRRGSIFAQ